MNQWAANYWHASMFHGNMFVGSAAGAVARERQPARFVGATRTAGAIAKAGGAAKNISLIGDDETVAKIGPQAVQARI